MKKKYFITIYKADWYQVDGNNYNSMNYNEKLIAGIQNASDHELLEYRRLYPFPEYIIKSEVMLNSLN